MPTLQVIVASIRPGRIGAAFGDWIVERATEHACFDVELVDLKQVALPLHDEPRHPRLQQYEHDHTKAWSATIERADAFVFVIPEYNFFAPPALVNAITYLSREWAHKPAGILSYGGVSAGLRSAQSVRQLLAAVAVVPLNAAVSLPFAPKFLDDDGVVQANDVMTGAAATMLDELLRWQGALATLRA